MRAIQGVTAFTTFESSADRDRSPVDLVRYPGPVSNAQVEVQILQSVGATEPLRTGTYAKTLTFTLSTTEP